MYVLTSRNLINDRNFELLSAPTDVFAYVLRSSGSLLRTSAAACYRCRLACIETDTVVAVHTPNIIARRKKYMFSNCCASKFICF